MGPMGRVSPKFPTGDISRTFIANKGDGVPLLCPAQGFPAPAFRYLIKFQQHTHCNPNRTHGQSVAEVSIDGNRSQLYIFFQLVCDFALPGSGIPLSNVQVHCFFYVFRACGSSFTEICIDGQFEEFQYYV